MNQRVLVTAGASGIGREIARAFAANGAKVFVSDIDAKRLDARSKEIRGVMTKVCDNSKRSAAMWTWFSPVCPSLTQWKSLWRDGAIRDLG